MSPLIIVCSLPQLTPKCFVYMTNDMFRSILSEKKNMVPNERKKD